MQYPVKRRTFLHRISALAGSASVAACGGGDGVAGAGPLGPAPAATAVTPRTPRAGSLVVGTELQRQPMDLARMIVFDTWHESSRYERFQRLVVLKGNVAEIKFHGEDFAAGGAVRALEAARYTLEVDGAAMAVATITRGSARGSFVLDLAPLAEGWHVFHIAGGTAETCPRWYMFVDKGSARAAWSMPIPVATGSYDVAHRGTAHYHALLPHALRPELHRRRGRRRRPCACP